MDIISFENKNYPIRDINMPFGGRIISVVELNDVLMKEDGSYSSNEARLIDEQIFYFVDNEDLALDEDELAHKILSEI